MATISANGVTVPLVRYAVAGAYRKEFVFAELLGAPTAVRAVWGDLVSFPARTFVVRRDDGTEFTAHTPQNSQPFRSLNTRLSAGVYQVVIIHNDATHGAEGDTRFILGAGADGPPEGLIPRLNAWLDYPLREQWASTIWELGQTHGAIRALDASGIAAAEVNTSSPAWSTIVLSAVMEHGI